MIYLKNDESIYSITSNSSIKLTIGYDKARSGADMLYRLYTRVYISSSAYFGDKIGIEIYIDGVQRYYNASFKGSTGSTTGWDISKYLPSNSTYYTSTNKTSGQSSISVRCWDASGAASFNKTFSYNVDILPAGSILGTLPADFNIDSGIFPLAISTYLSTCYQELVVSIFKDNQYEYHKTIEDIVDTDSVSFEDTMTNLEQIYFNGSVRNRTFKFDLSTYTDNTKATKVGDTSTRYSIGKMLTTDENLKPIIQSLSYETTDDLTATLTGDTTKQKVIQGISLIRPTLIYFTLNRSASLSSIAVNDINRSFRPVTVDHCSIENRIQRVTSSNSIKAVIQDSRNLISNQFIKTITDFIAYSNPSKSSSYADNWYTRNEQGLGTLVTIHLGGHYTDVNFGSVSNSMSVVSAKKKLTSVATWEDININITNSNGTYYFDSELTDTFDVDKSYNIQIIVKDAVGAITITHDFIIGAASPGIALVDNYVALGKAVDESQVANFPVQLSDKSGIYNKNGILVSLLDLIYPIGVLYISSNTISPETLFGGSWERLSGYYLYCGETPGSIDGSSNTGSTILTAAQSGIPAHTHDGTTASKGAHTHNAQGFWRGSGQTSQDRVLSYVKTSDNANNTYGTTSILSAGAHTHPFTTDAGSDVDAAEGHTHLCDPTRISMYVWKRTA